MLAARVGIQPDVLLPGSPAMSVLAFNVLWLAVIDVVLEQAGQRSLWPLRLPALARLGQMSYGLYLYHFPVLAILLDIAAGLGFLGKVYPLKILSIVLSIGLARISWQFIERPILGLKSRLAYRPNRAITATRTVPGWSAHPARRLFPSHKRARAGRATA